MSTTSQAVSAPRYDIDPTHTSAQFKVRHLMISNVKGEFTKISGSAVFDPSNPLASSIDVTIDATSINTREPQRGEPSEERRFSGCRESSVDHF